MQTASGTAGQVVDAGVAGDVNGALGAGVTTVTNTGAVLTANLVPANTQPVVNTVAAGTNTQPVQTVPAGTTVQTVPAGTTVQQG